MLAVFVTTFLIFGIVFAVLETPGALAMVVKFVGATVICGIGLVVLINSKTIHNEWHDKQINVFADVPKIKPQQGITSWDTILMADRIR